METNNAKAGAAAVDPAVRNARFLNKSGWTFCIIGVIAFIIGLLVGVGGIWIPGCAAIASGVYLLVKGRQEMHSDTKTP